MHDFTHFSGEVFLEFGNTPAPVVGALLRDELNVEEAALARPEVLAGSDAADDARGHVCY